MTTVSMNEKDLLVGDSTTDMHYASGHPTAEKADCPWCNSKPDTRMRYILYKENSSGLIYYKRESMEPTTIRKHASRYLLEDVADRACSGSWMISEWRDDYSFYE